MIEILSMFANIALAALLVAVIVYCRTLNTNIRVLQDSRSEMAKLFAEFDQSIERASSSIYELKEAARKSDVVLKEKLDTANMIADDLSFMIERGTKMADQLETGLKGGRSALSQNAAKAAPAPEPAAPARNAAERAQQPTSRNTASLESVLEQMANRNNPAGNAPAKPGDAKPNTRIRSKAEQELLDSLKSGR
ncbi:MAG: hypothetical protein FJX23_06950 [Alphaproteobacteria bacterium]|nr:hypothetical protein [Alphaproteobacteria bacterium]